MKDAWQLIEQNRVVSDRIAIGDRFTCATWRWGSEPAEPTGAGCADRAKLTPRMPKAIEPGRSGAAGERGWDDDMGHAALR